MGREVPARHPERSEDHGAAEFPGLNLQALPAPCCLLGADFCRVFAPRLPPSPQDTLALLLWGVWCCWHLQVVLLGVFSRIRYLSLLLPP